MIYTNLSEQQLKQAIQTKITIHKKQDTTSELFKQIDNEANLMSRLLKCPFYHCKLSLLWIENTLKDNR
jgi:hypothetical protein